MKLLHSFLLLLAAVAAVFATNDGLTDIVSWDEYSLMVNGERVFSLAGELYGSVVIDLWSKQANQKCLAAITSASPTPYYGETPRRGVFDFTTPPRDVQLLFDIAKEVGLYVIARPGPYCNAETNGGGLALWGSDGSLGSVRTSDETYHQAWLPWITAIGEIIAKNQITSGGNVIIQQIENELQETRYDPTNTLVIYMEQIENATRNAGIIVPTSHNEKGERSVSWSTDYMDVGGAVNLYGLDSYPGGFSCTNINSGFNVVRNYYQWFHNYSYTQPEYLPEFEAGYFTPWGGSFYDSCLAEHDPAYADVYYKNNVGQRTTLMSLYMAFGGTNWGNLAAPVVYTSYDYSAPLRETREIQLKFKQTKLLGLFTRVSEGLLKTYMESNGTGNAVSTPEVYSWVLRNPDTGAGFYTVQQNSTPSRAVVTFSAYLQTSAGNITVPDVQLNGRQSKILTTDYQFGNHTLLYCSTDILTFGVFGKETVLVMYADVGQTSELAFTGPLRSNAFVVHGDANFTGHPNSRNASSPGFARYRWTQTEGSTVVRFQNGVTLYLLGTETAWDFFAPSTTSDPHITANDQVFVLGPYNVRNVTVDGGSVTLIGDNQNATDIEVYSGYSAHSIVWNGMKLHTTVSDYGSLKASIHGTADRTIELPNLSWVVANSLPEKERGYGDAKWTVCNKTTTLSKTAPLTLPVLFSSDYGYYPGIKLYRGYFDDTSATSANITVQGGAAAGFTAWLNGHFVGGNTGNATSWTASALLDFSGATMYNKSNVLTVVTDYTGHDEASTGPAGVENPRGILGAFLYGTNGTLNFTQWRIQGNAGGDANIDPVRGSLNEDGLHGTRLGWHLPGFAATGPAWSDGSPYQGLNTSGINWYITRFKLAIEDDLDVPLGIEFGSPTGTKASVQLYVNGYQYGKYIPQIGPQTRFPFPPGVINNNGENTISVAVWAQTDAGARLTNSSLFAYGKYQTGFDFSQDWSDLQPG